MAIPFDRLRFDYRLGKVLASGGKFDRRMAKVDRLRKEYAKLHDEAAQNYVNRAIDEVVLFAMIDTCQPFRVVSRRYRCNVRGGFNSRWSEVFSTIWFAEYCREQERVAYGLQRLLAVKKALSASREKLPKGIKGLLLGEIEKSVRRLQREEQDSA